MSEFSQKKEFFYHQNSNCFYYFHPECVCMTIAPNHNCFSGGKDNLSNRWLIILFTPFSNHSLDLGGNSQHWWWCLFSIFHHHHHCHFLICLRKEVRGLVVVAARQNWIFEVPVALNLNRWSQMAANLTIGRRWTTKRKSAAAAWLAIIKRQTNRKRTRGRRFLSSLSPFSEP